ncbi:preprotein translocase subunit TatA [Halobacteriales archaeon SW_7_68_16]|nr:MAG: preprotein translocase subunit TatA [Halobacteriales archaeon SW_7_68_16]
MPLSAHIEEMVRRLAIVLVIAGVATIVTFPIAERVIVRLWFGVLPETVTTSAGETIQTAPRVYGPLELKFAELKTAGLAGLVAALPAFVYQSYRFMRPGLYPNERRYYLAAVPTSLVLAVVGVAFGYLLVLPLLFDYFLYYSQGTAEIAFALGQTYGLMLVLLGTLAVTFQIPLFVMLAVMMGVTTRRRLAELRLYFWLAFAGIAFAINPDLTGVAPFVVGGTMVALFEGTLLLLRWTGR